MIDGLVACVVLSLYKNINWYIFNDNKIVLTDIDKSDYKSEKEFQLFFI